MIYELSLVTKSDLTEETQASVKKIVHDVLADMGGEVLIEDDWGKLTFAQATSDGTESGHFVHFIYSTGANTNTELLRRFKINESVIKSLIVKLGEDEEREAVVKGYKTPFSKTYNGSATDALNADGEAENPKKFARRKTCWFKANNITADWKDPATFSWIVNEFGKISPARISGISRKHQRTATEAVKRARQIGIASYVSSRIAHK